jgi:hypothetical protein
MDKLPLNCAVNSERVFPEPGHREQRFRVGRVILSSANQLVRCCPAIAKCFVTGEPSILVGFVEFPSDGFTLVTGAVASAIFLPLRCYELSRTGPLQTERTPFPCPKPSRPASASILAEEHYLPGLNSSLFLKVVEKFSEFATTATT